MQVKNCLILAAGFGTRMGEIGKILPKVMWPVFEKSLLELQVLYAKQLGCENIYINLHHGMETIEKMCLGNHTFAQVTFLKEQPDILDIGGGIHNLARTQKTPYQGNLLILNADQFFWLDKTQINEAAEKLHSATAVLFNYTVNSSDGYNAVESDANGRMLNIVQNKDLLPNQQIETYTGISIVNLEALRPQKGSSKFFDSIANYKQSNVQIQKIVNPVYWDFGTAKRYYRSMFGILEIIKNKKDDPFINFLYSVDAIARNKINIAANSYNTLMTRSICLGHEICEGDFENKIILQNDTKNIFDEKKPEIVYNELSVVV